MLDSRDLENGTATGMMHYEKVRMRLMIVGAVAALALTACSTGTPTSPATVTSEVTVGAAPNASTGSSPAGEVPPPPSGDSATGAASPPGSAAGTLLSPTSGSPSDTAATTSAATTATTTMTVNRAQINTQPKNGATGVSPITPVVVTAKNGELAAVAMTNPEGREVAGTLSADKTRWTSTEPLGYNRSYTISATAKDPVGTNDSTSKFTTLKPKQKVFPSFFPNPQMKTVGVGQPMVVIFDKPPVDRAAAEKTLTVKTVPAVQGAWYWWDDRTLHYRPKTYWKPGTKITVTAKVYGVNFGAGMYGETDRTLNLTIGDAKIAKIDDATKQMKVYINDKLNRTVPVSMGMDKTTTVNGKKISFVTPSGTYVAQEKYKVKQMSSATYGLPTSYDLGYDKAIPLAVRLSGSGIFIHSAPWSVADQGVRNVSHGCINIKPTDATWFYNTFSFGDIVQVTGTSTQLEPTDGFGDWNIPWNQWVQGSAL